MEPPQQATEGDGGARPRTAPLSLRPLRLRHSRRRQRSLSLRPLRLRPSRQRQVVAGPRTTSFALRPLRLRPSRVPTSRPPACFLSRPARVRSVVRAPSPLLTRSSPTTLNSTASAPVHVRHVPHFVSLSAHALRAIHIPVKSQKAIAAATVLAGFMLPPVYGPSQ